jgi:hypothetical protein
MAVTITVAQQKGGAGKTTLAANLAAALAATRRVAVVDIDPQRSLTQKEAVELCMGRSRALPNGEYALLFDLPRDSPQRAAFYEALTGLKPAQVNSYWARLMFSGQTVPPQPLPDEQAMADLVKRNPSAMGYLSKEPTDKALRTVLVLKEAN